MANRGVDRTESIVNSSAGTFRGLETLPATSGALDAPALAFENVLASLARIEARLDAAEQRSATTQPPPRPDPDPPYQDWRPWREESGRQNAILTAAMVSSIPHLGFVGGSSSHLPQQARPEPEPLYEDWQRGRGETTRLRPIISPATTVASQQNLGFVGPSFKVANQPLETEQLTWDRYGGGSDGFRGRRHRAWDNPAHRLSDQPGRLATEWEPPRPDPDPPYSEWQRGRDDTTRHRAVLTTATGVSALPHLGFGGGNSTRGPLHANLSGASPWDREVLSGMGNRSR
ncbi:hypothetical protein SASPL_154668 [Salvia splendens]|uniref:Uncharacterized protein n=1 Tax=Salvia splendens TaxID=180675 RepID=A0A8X8YZZ6_SALSN|nr:hypothetical protein SASPL_154668 [Salvia splendens]